MDLLLIHWPWQSKSAGNVTSNTTQSTDPACNTTSPVYSESGCRLSTWKALVQIWASGGARAIGVSNYNVTHLQVRLFSALRSLLCLCVCCDHTLVIASSTTVYLLFNACCCASQEIVDAGMVLPSVNQMPFHLYR